MSRQLQVLVTSSFNNNSFAEATTCLSRVPNTIDHFYTILWQQYFVTLYLVSPSDCHTTRADIVFLLDASHSVEGFGFFESRVLLLDLVSKAFELGNSTVQLGLTSFGTAVYEHLTLTESLQGQQELRRAVVGVPYNGG